MQMSSNRRVLVTGATGFLGYRVVVALLEAGAEVTVLVRPDRQQVLQPLSHQITITHADVWNRASLKGRGRGHASVIHLVGSTHADPARGLTFNQINLVSARNVTGMAVSDGIPLMIFLSTVMRPGDLPGEYILSKREAEEYLRNSGLQWTVVRAPALFPPDRRMGLRMLSAVGSLWPLSWLVGRMMPLSADVAARGLAGIALNPKPYTNRVIYAGHLRRLARQSGRRSPLPRPVRQQDDDPEGLDEPPFGWLPRR